MATKKIPGKDDFVWVRSIYGKGPDAAKRYHYIAEGGMNDVIKEWHAKQPKRQKLLASPSTLLTCPRVIWFQNNGVEPLSDMTWAVKQRLMLGRQLENMFADQLKDSGMLLFHWKDDEEDADQKFHYDEDKDSHFAGVPDYILQLEEVAMSDAKTVRSDGLGYVPIEMEDAWQEWNYFKYKIQLTAYYMLCHRNKQWFIDNNVPLPAVCHLFLYSLDDGLVRREFTWKPTQEDMELVIKAARRFNAAVRSKEAPDCTCRKSFGEFDVKFCDYGVKEEGSKVNVSCCSDDLIP